MSNPSSDSYRNPLRYQGQDYSFAPRYLRPRDPAAPTNASADIKPKEQQGHYPLGSLWTNSANGNLWALATITNNKAHWILIGSTNDNPVLAFNVPNGTTPIVPDSVGAVTFTSTGGTVVITGSSAAPNNTNINFDVLGGAAPIEKIAVDANTGPGTNPVVPTALGQVSITGGQVAAGTTTNVIRTDSLAANTFTVEVQRSAAVATTTIGSNGVSHYASSQFAVDANGFVSLLGGALPAIQRVVVQTFAVTGTYTPTTNMRYCIVELVGGGGGGGGVASTDASTAAAAAGGGGGGYARRLLTAAQIGASKAVTIGTGGTGGAAGNNAGLGGGTTSLGVLLSATGGSGGSGSAGSTVTASTAPGTSGGSGSTGDLNLTGSNSGGGHVWFNAASFAFGLSGDGGSSFFGGTVTGGSGNNNGAAGNLGAGGAGGTDNTSNGTGQSGGNGGNGFMIITEFCS